MNQEITGDLLKELYERYKEFLLPVALIFISLFLLFKFVLPLGGTIVSNKQARDDAMRDLNIVESNYKLVSSSDAQALEQDSEVLTQALPLEKDFAGILAAISGAGISSGVSVGNFEFQVGDISSTESNTGGKTSLQLLVNIQGDAQSIISFVNKINESLPLAEVNSVDFNQAGAVVNISFYYKPLNKADIADNIPLRNISAKDRELVTNLQRFQNTQIFLVPTPAPEIPSSPSAVEESSPSVTPSL